jgi:hypothetical protein
VNQVNNDNVHQSMEAISGNKNIHSLSSVMKERDGDLLLNMCSTLQSNSCNNILKCVVRLLYVHSHWDIETNEYLDHQWYDHTKTMKGGPL